MSDAQNDQPSKLSSVAVLPWTVALVLFLLLLGVLTALGLGLTTDPFAEPEMTESSPADPEMQPEAAAAPEAPEVPVTGAVPELDMAPDMANQTGTGAEPEDVPSETDMGEAVPALPAIPEIFETNSTDEASSAEAAETASESPEPAQPSPPEEVVAAAPAPPTAAPPVTAPPAVVPAAPVLPRRTASALPPAPDPGLIEASPQGPLPKIGPDGREPWKVYARPFDSSDGRPRVAIVLSGLGLSSAATEAAIQGLPSEVTLAFQPFADNIQQWIRLSRAAGHEVLLNLPMEPVDIRSNDPGPRALFVSFTPEENLDRMRWALSRVTGYVGVVNHMGSRFTVSRDAMQPVLTELKARGLLFLDARSAARSVATSLASEMQVPRAINDRFLDNREVSRATVDARLAEVESIAKEAGVSIAIGQAFPVTIERIRAWADTLEEKGIALVPISAVVDKQSDR